ncbi:MAG: hypothetical protein Q9216_006997, partial [Gyalolechia sp. 2 TL-2023]
LKHPGTVVFLWSGDVEKRKPRLPKNTGFDWFEGREKQLIAFEKITAIVQGEFPQARAETERSHDCNEREKKDPSVAEKRVESKPSEVNRERAVIGASITTPKVTGPERPQTRDKSCPPPTRYQANAAPFDVFTRHKIGPLDSNPDIVWQLERGFYRAYRLSTLKPDPMATPKLVTTRNAKAVLVDAKGWLTRLKRRATGNPDARWDDRRPRSREQCHSTSGSQAGQAVDTASQSSRAKQHVKYHPGGVPRLDQQQGRQYQTVPGDDRTIKTDRNTTGIDNSFPSNTAPRHKRKSDDEHTATAGAKRAKTTPEERQKPVHCFSSPAIIPAPPQENGIHINQYHKLFQHTKPQSSNAVIQQHTPHISANYFAEQSSLVAQSFNQPQCGKQEQDSFTALLGADAFSTPADWGPTQKDANECSENHDGSLGEKYDS